MPAYMIRVWSLLLRLWVATLVGWQPQLLLASAYGCGPDLIYLPETDFDMDQFLTDVDRVYKEKETAWWPCQKGFITLTAASFL